jgi:hypothetical protein
MRARKYGSTRETIQSMMSDQKNVCAICENPFKNANDTHIDHCHSTGRIRGILCSACNHGLGKFRDNPDYLRAAAAYVE